MNTIEIDINLIKRIKESMKKVQDSKEPSYCSCYGFCKCVNYSYSYDAEEISCLEKLIDELEQG